MQAGSQVQAVELEIFSLGDALFAFLQEDVAGRAGRDSAAGVVEEDAIVFGDVQDTHGLAVAIVRARESKGELDGLVLGLKGHADHVLCRWLGEVYFRKRFLFLLGHVSFHF